MSSVNKAIIVGNLGRDPEIRSLNNGTQVARMTVATSERWKDKQSGDWNEKTEWHKVTIFNEHLVKFAERLTKGSKVYLEGAIQTRKWTDKDGAERYSTEIVLQRFRGELVLLDGKSGDGHSAGNSAAASDDFDSIPF